MSYHSYSSLILAVPHIEQEYAGECLAAGVSMICEYFEQRYSYQRLVRLLEIERYIGTYFGNVLKLETVGIAVLYEKDGTLETLRRLLVAGWPVLVSVQTIHLPHWDQVSSQHILVAVGIDSDAIYVNDPEMTNGYIRVDIGNFMLAWDVHDYRFTVLTPS